MTTICFLSGVISHNGGTERVGTMIANVLSDYGYDVRILSFWNHGTPFFAVDDRVKIDYLMNPKTEGKLFHTYLYPVWKLRNYVKANHIDVLIDIDSVLAYWTVPSLCGLFCRHIVWDHFNYFHAQTEPRRVTALRLIHGHVDRLVLLTHQDKRMYLDAGFSEQQLTVINNPTPFEHVAPSPRSEHRVIAVGRLTDQKGCDRLISAWSRIHQMVGDWRLTFVGSGELRDDLMRQAEDAEIDNIDFISATQNVQEWYDKASIYALTSRYEGFPMVLLEAMSKGLPIVANDCLTGPRELVHDSVNGYLVADGDMDSFADKLLSLINDRAKQDEFSCHALSMSKAFHIKPIADKWRALIDDLT
ncbi:glycosyltransferase family 4 protein [Bifidobacterium vespertilionis]|uniref:glycosyltransferase family 4 protein n=1 Tax=Bifidobacterium vespertilionis TaxID=2562524 RepID=UPI001BDBC1AF|nr:glycosyltransferase family 4 protein [Bifidobacterium vespertilionis]MBT1179930.1 glycosyltransferase family 4 protein [Bifidobacterium vespertilionis]